MREDQVRICERLRVKFPGPTRQGRPGRQAGRTAGLSPAPEISVRYRHLRFVPTRDINAVTIA